MLPFFPALRLLLLTTAAIGLLVLTGCGVKGPPRPPQMTPPPPVTDLQGRVEDGRALLTWTLPGRGLRREMEVTGFRVYRSRTPLAEGDCPTCPLRFEQAAELMSPGREARAAMTFSEALQPGYQYTYKVVGFGAGDARFDDSNLVELVFP
jgi:predicted small lipoprotein YifL